MNKNLYSGKLIAVDGPEWGRKDYNYTRIKKRVGETEN